MTISKSAVAGSTPSRAITFVVMKHDLTALETDLPHYSATQPFLECTIIQSARESPPSEELAFG